MFWNVEIGVYHSGHVEDVSMLEGKWLEVSLRREGMIQTFFMFGGEVIEANAYFSIEGVNGMFTSGSLRGVYFEVAECRKA